VTVVIEAQNDNGEWVTAASYYGYNHTVKYRVTVTGITDDPNLEWSISGEIEDSLKGLAGGKGKFTVDNTNPIAIIEFTVDLEGYKKHENIASMKQIENNVDQFLVPEVLESTAAVTLYNRGGGDDEYIPPYYPPGGGGDPSNPYTPPQPPVTIPDTPPPTTQLPDYVVPGQDEYVTIDEEEIPMGNLPQTGTSGVRGFGFIATGISGLIALFVTKKKRDGSDNL
jgi:LPXTG-motif cell wall-anchored protein